MPSEARKAVLTSELPEQSVPVPPYDEQDDATFPEQCPIYADDGVRCQRRVHFPDPAHDFSVQGPAHEAVDGGRSWQHWITVVHTVRAALDGLPVPHATEGQVTEPYDHMATALLRIAAAVGMQGTTEEGTIVFRHPEGIIIKEGT